MELLTPEKVRNDKTERIAEQGRIAQNAATVTAKTLKKLNDAKDREARQREKEDAQFLHEASQAQIKRDALLTEVAALETRKEEALKPITEMQTAAEMLMSDAQGRLSAVSKREQAVAEQESVVAEKMDRIDEITFGLTKKQTALDNREKRVVATETMAKKSTDTLANKWVEYHNAVNASNRDLASREHGVKLSEQANEIARLEMIKRSHALDERERGIKDRYETMLATEREWEQKQHDRRQNRQ